MMYCSACRKAFHDLGCYVKTDNIIKPACRTCMAISNIDNINKESEVLAIKKASYDEIPKRGNATLLVLITEEMFKTCMTGLLDPNRFINDGRNKDE